MTGTTNSSAHKFSLAAKAKDYYQLIKFSLSFMVVFSCVICYLLAPKIVDFDWGMLVLLTIAGLLVTGSANAINKAVEKDTDAQMKPVADQLQQEECRNKKLTSLQFYLACWDAP